MKKMYCPECGGEIIITKEALSHSYEINNDTLECIDNNDLMSGDGHLIFHCINDREHNIEPTPTSDITPIEYSEWENEVSMYFFENVLPNL